MIAGQPLACFQPFIDTATGRIAGVEALARLRNEDGQLHSAGPLFSDPKTPPAALRRLDRAVRPQFPRQYSLRYTNQPCLRVSLEMRHARIAMLSFASPWGVAGFLRRNRPRQHTRPVRRGAGSHRGWRDQRSACATTGWARSRSVARNRPTCRVSQCPPFRSC